MRILIVSYLYPPEVQSAAVMARELACDLTRMGHRVSVITGWPSHPEGRLFDGWASGFRDRGRDPGGFEVLRCGHALLPRRRMSGRLLHQAFKALYFADFTVAVLVLFVFYVLLAIAVAVAAVSAASRGSDCDCDCDSDCGLEACDCGLKAFNPEPTRWTSMAAGQRGGATSNGLRELP